MYASPPSLDVLVIGAGQAGLAMGHHLKQSGLRFLLVDGHERIGDSWRKRFDSLELFTPRAYSALPGLPVPGDPQGYPTKDELADYLASYAAHFDIPVQTSTRVDRLTRLNDVFQATTEDGGTLTAHAVVIATGAFQQPVEPPIAGQLGRDVLQLTPEEYRNPGQVPNGMVLIVGDGATGRQIARELGETHWVLLATGRPRRVSRDRILGKSVFWWMDKLGLIRKSRHTRIGRKLMLADPFPGKHLELDRLRKRGIIVVGRLSTVAGRSVSFESGSPAEVDTVIWATGYRDRTDWVKIPGAVDQAGAFVEDRGVSPVPGLYFIGRSWQWSRGSALVTGAGEDARYVAGEIRQSLRTTEVKPSPVDARAERVAAAS